MGNSIIIRELNILSNKQDRKEFIDIPWQIYKYDKTWVPPLKLSLMDLLNEKHPFYKTAKVKSWIAYKDNIAVGRILAVVNDVYNDFHQEKTGQFGLFESIDDEEVSTALLNKAEEFVKNNGMNELQGPVNPSTNYECGSLVEGEVDPPQLMMTYNHLYYDQLYKSFGLSKAKDLIAYRGDTSIQMPEVILKIAKRTERSNKLSYRKISKKNWQREVDLMYDIYNSAWEKNWGFIPMTKEEFYHTAKDLKSVVDEDLILFAEVDKKAVGFIVCLPDYNQVFKHIPNGKLLPFGILKLLNAKKYINRVRVITLGVMPEYRKMGLTSLLFKQIQIEVQNKKIYKEAEMSWILEDNIEMNRPLVRMGLEPYKTYRIYEKSI